jgi:hypothetical protein
VAWRKKFRLVALCQLTFKPGALLDGEKNVRTDNEFAGTVPAIHSGQLMIQLPFHRPDFNEKFSTCFRPAWFSCFISSQ